MIPLLREYLLDNWSTLPLDSPSPRDLAFLVQATGVSKLCCFIFPDDARRPRWVAKMSRSPRDNAVLASEYHLVQWLRERGSDFVRATVPGPLFTAHIAGHLVGIEAYLPGRPMDGLLMSAANRNEQVYRDYLDLATDWLLRSQQETPHPHDRLTDQQRSSFFLEPIRQMKATAQLREVEESYLDYLARQILTLAERPLPLVFNHGDLRLGNILLDGQSLQVIDWEFGVPIALPLMDVFSLLARTHASVQGMEEIDGYLEDYWAAFEDVFLQGGAFSGLTLDYVGRACRALDFDPAWVNVLFAMFLVTEANRFYAFLGQRAERGYVYLLRSREGRISRSHAEQLARQKNVWLLGHLAQHEAQLVFHQLPASSRLDPGARPQNVVQAA